MIVRNEEEFLTKSLQSIKGVVDEIILVDTGSTDSTVDIGRRLGARVLFHEWRNDFSEARNFALSSATGDWILVIDADEELDEETRTKLRDFVEASDADGLEITVRSEMPETDILKYEDSKIVRLFRNRSEYRYAMPIHEQVRLSIEKSGGIIASSDLLIVHHGYARRTVQGNESRTQRNLKVLNEASVTFPDDPYLHYQIGLTMMSAGRRDDAYDELKKVLLLDYSRLGPAIIERFFMKISQLALDKNEDEEALNYARESLKYNPRNGISMYVEAVALLSMKRIREGYEVLLKIKGSHDRSLRLDAQLDRLIRACGELLNG